MELLKGEPQSISKGDHVLTIELNGGTASLQYFVSGIAKTVPGSNVETEGVIVKLAAGKVQALITGGARVWLNEA